MSAGGRDARAGVGAGLREADGTGLRAAGDARSPAPEGTGARATAGPGPRRAGSTGARADGGKDLPPSDGTASRATYGTGSPPLGDPGPRTTDVTDRRVTVGSGSSPSEGMAPRDAYGTTPRDACRTDSPPVDDRGSRAWEARAACRFQDAELWFSRRTWARAMAICAACPVLEHCRAAVLRREKGLPRCHRNGVVAGLTGPQRHALDRRAEREAGGGREPQARSPAAPRPACPAPCGTRAAYQRHLRRREPVDEACRSANARGAGRYRRTGSTTPRPPSPRCGPDPRSSSPEH
ncbi:WhiB family transcriptional regulator [Streptomyces antibioticus]|uniref:WhiB family transcriptional regulator n=1 Tax=Streptomyces antibioticus TaxID=1890 RepID=UPI000D19B541